MGIMRLGYFVVIERNIKDFDADMEIVKPPLEIVACYQKEADALAYASAIVNDYYKVRVVACPLIFDGVRL